MAENPNAGEGFLSQEEIDAALNATAGGEGLSQEQIDAALGGSSEAAADEAGQEGGDFTQADIDAAIAAASGGDAGAEAAGLSQADIDAALADVAGPAPPVDDRLDSAGRPFDEVAAAMAAAIEEEKAAATTASPDAGGVPVEFPDFGGAGGGDGLGHKIDLLHDVNLRVKIELGRTRMLVEEVLKLGEGSVVELNKLAGDPVDVFANDRLIARGEVLVLNDNFCVRVSEVVSEETGAAAEV